RLLELIRRPPAGGNRYDYKRWAMSVDGVTGAYIYPLRRGLGTVDTVITSADGLPSDVIIKNVQTYIDDVRPVTAKNHMVLAPTIKTVNFNISVSLSGVTLANATANIKSAIGDYFDSLQPGDSIIRSQIEMLISQITGVIDRDVNSPETNVTASVNASTVEWLRVGDVEVSSL
ncbi:baseplate J/gp47 family protein, partial [Lonsdalea britannica]|uniref:baseplate J/gp47 family protein n=1 Tax=Lonsdalea britannica TaxID=1082704 RepID=UPI0026EAC489